MITTGGAISVQPAVDLRSEVLSAPTDEMWEAMRGASVGWYDYEEDRNVEVLEKRVAELTGMGAAYLVITGSFANTIALLTLADAVPHLVIGRGSHIARREAEGLRRLAGAATFHVGESHLGGMEPDELGREVRRASVKPGCCIACLENTTVAEGRALGADETATFAAMARESGARYVYLDGARLWNAAVAEDIDIHRLLTGVDAGMVSLTKGVGAPVGAVVVGSDEFIRRARITAKLLGGHSVHRMGYFAAAASIALEAAPAQLKDDHRRARSLVDGISGIEGLAVDARNVRTNIVRVEVTTRLDAQTFVTRLLEEGVGATVMDAAAVRFTTHREVGDRDIEAAIRAIRHVMSDAPMMDGAPSD